MRRPPIEQVTIVILAFDAPSQLLERAVTAVLADIDTDSSGRRLELVVVDNGSSANERLAEIRTGAGTGVMAPVEVVETGSNRGYAGGMNVGIRLGLERGADAVALLNDDVVVGSGWLDPLIQEMEQAADIGSVQPTLLHSTDGREESDRAQTVNSAGVVIDPFGAGTDRLRDIAVDGLSTEASDIEAFTGGAVLIHRDLFDDIGVFDERFFLYYEDVELARRAARAGWRHRHVPASTVRHVGSATTVRLGDDRRRLQERNRIWSSVMHGSAREVVSGLGLSMRRLRHPPRAAHRRALIEGLAGTPSRLVDRFRRRRQ